MQNKNQEGVQREGVSAEEILDNFNYYDEINTTKLYIRSTVLAAMELYAVQKEISSEVLDMPIWVPCNSGEPFAENLRETTISELLKK